jgi:hypothetical protein
VLTQVEVQRRLAMTGRHAVMARLLDGSGLRLQDGDVDQRRICGRGGTGGQNRATPRLAPGVTIRVRQARRGHAAVKPPERDTPSLAQDIRPCHRLWDW